MPLSIETASRPHPEEPTPSAAQTKAPRESRSGRRATASLRIAALTFVFALVWLVLAGPDLGSWLIGAPTVIAAIWAATRLAGLQGGGVSVLGLVQFVPFFLWESLKGGIDVALRVIAPRLNVNPGYLGYRLRLGRPAARVFFMNMVSLLPGTLSVNIEGNEVRVHALDRDANPVPELVRLERRVAALFAERQTDPEEVQR